jgi:ribonuclease-3
VVTHSSWTERRSESYERLAFLGDSVLGLAVTSHLYPMLEADRFGAGELSKVRAQVVSGRSCFAVAQRLELPRALVTAAPQGMEHVGRALAEVEHVISDALEAVIGACFLTYGFEETADAVIGAFEAEIDVALSEPLDFKSALQERLARDGLTVAYEVTSSTGPPHAPTFRIEARVKGAAVGQGEGRSKKAAEQRAAREALEGLEA